MAVASHEPVARKACQAQRSIMNLFKQRARVLGSTSEWERVIGCEKKQRAGRSGRSLHAARPGDLNVLRNIEIADAFPACKVRACRRLGKAAGL